MPLCAFIQAGAACRARRQRAGRSGKYVDRPQLLSDTRRITPYGRYAIAGPAIPRYTLGSIQPGHLLGPLKKVEVMPSPVACVRASLAASPLRMHLRMPSELFDARPA